MGKQFWKWSKAESGSELILEGVIASESWFEDEVTPKMFRDELAQHPGNVTVRINSPGGDVSAGVAIYNMLNEHEGEVTVKVDGIAASIASLISMAGDKIIMLPGSMMMIHLPWTIAAGNSEDMAQVIEMLEKTGESMIPIYAARTGLSEERIEELLKNETWMTAEDAVELGFADEAVGAKSTLAQSMATISDMQSSMQSAVMQPVMSLKALKAQEEEDATDTTKESPEVPAEQAETDGEDTPNTEVTEDDIKEFDKPETEEVVETTVEETNESTEGTEMATQADIAETQVMTPENQAPVEAKASPKNYLKTKASLEDFTGVLMAHAGANAEEVKDAWKDVLVKNGLSDPDYFALPEPVITSIEDAVKSSGIYSLLNHTGLDVFKVVWDDTDSNTDTSRAGGHTRGDAKTEQVLDFDDRVIRAQYIYKYLTLDKETIRENRSTGALMRFVLNELPTRIIREIERAVVIGDGRANEADRKITSFTSIKADVAAENIFAAQYEPEADESRYETLIRAMDEIEAEGPVYLVHKKGFVTDLLLEQNANGGLVWAPGTDAVRAMGFAGSFQPTWFNDTTDPEYDAYLFVPSAYKTVGDSSIESFTNFALATNKNEFLQEIYKGGALAARKSAVGIAVAGS